MGKARKVRAIHADCPACGTTVVVNAETGEIEGIAREIPPTPEPAPAPANTPPNDPAGGDDGAQDPPADPEKSSFLSDW